MSEISTAKTDISKVKRFLQSKLAEVLDKSIQEELESVLSGLRENDSLTYLYTAFSKAVRLFGKSGLKYSIEERRGTEAFCSGWTPPNSIDKAVRILILLEIPMENENEFVKAIENLFATADVGEQVVIYSSLALFPF